MGASRSAGLFFMSSLVAGECKGWKTCRRYADYIMMFNTCKGGKEKTTLCFRNGRISLNKTTHFVGRYGTHADVPRHKEYEIDDLQVEALIHSLEGTCEDPHDLLLNNKCVSI